MGNILHLSIFALTFFTVYTQGGPVSSSNGPSIDWQPCSDNALIECGFYDVPLDYADLGAGNATLAVSRYKSTNTPRLGTLFTDPGGPGGSGTQLIQGDIGELIRNLTNAQYDIVGWDPRGVNLSTPTISCGFTSLEELFSSFNSSVLTVGVEAHGNFRDQNDIDNFYNQVNVTDADIRTFGQKCNESDGAFLKYMGTAAVVRDMVSLSDYFEGPGQKLNYWGFSYGTVIGNYFVNMFPDRVGRVILDGVVDTEVWASKPSLNMWSSGLRSVEATLAGFAATCAQAGPRGCAIAQEDSTGPSIVEWVRELIDTAYELGKKGVPGVSSTAIRGEMFTANGPGLYQPTTWVDLALELAANYTQFTNITDASGSNGMGKRSRLNTRSDASGGNFSNVVNPVNEAMSLIVISCVDSIDQDDVTTKDVFDELLRVSQDESPTFGELMPKDAGFVCHRFPVRAVERLIGPFNKRPAYPILVIGNEADPITPFASAKAVAAQYGSHARLLEQDGFGHASVAERSDCTHAVISDYFLTGALPTKHKMCGTNQVLFPGPGSTNSTLGDSPSSNTSDGIQSGISPHFDDALANASTSPSNNSTSTSDSDSDSSKLRKERNILAAVVGALGFVTLVLAVSLMCMCVRRRKNARYASLMTANAFGGARGVERDSLEGEGVYVTPWNGKRG